MLTFEQLSFGYFVALVASLPFAPGSRSTRVTAAVAAGAAALVVLSAAARLPLDARAWLGHLYLALGYWIPSLPASRVGVSRFERWLAASEARWLPYLAAVPRHLALVGEAAYLMCFPMVPAAFLIVWLAGGSADIDRFWSAVLGAGFLCYVATPWLAARPPRLLPAAAAVAHPLGRLNTAILTRVSHNLTTFPSGHVAVAAALALALTPVSQAGASVFMVLTLGIALGAAAGRYHYTVDVLAGLATGIAASLIALRIVPAL